jgi:hypothetical protein
VGAWPTGRAFTALGGIVNLELDLYWRLGEIKGLVDWALASDRVARHDLLQRVAAKVDALVEDLLRG